MNRLNPLLLLLFLLLFPAVCPAAPAGDVTAQEILRAVDDLWRGTSSYAEISMEIVTARWKRTLELKAWSLGTDRSLAVITSPAKEKGTATLMAGQDIWNYLPRVNRVIRVPSSMMSASWMGSHFTNDDLVKESRFSEDYDASVTFQGLREGMEVFEITLAPRPEAPVVWGKVVFTVTRDGYLPVLALYYDEEGALARTETFSEVGVLGGRRIPRLLTLIPADKPGERTVVLYRALDLTIQLDEGFFSIQKLSQGGLDR